MTKTITNTTMETLPQANDFNRILELVKAVHTLTTKKEKATQGNLQKELKWEPRDVSYYVHAAVTADILNFTVIENKKHTYSLTKETQQALAFGNHKSVASFFISKIMNNDICKFIIHTYLDNGKYLSKKQLAKHIKENTEITLSESTIMRRISSVVSWSRWAIQNMKFVY